MWADHVWCSLDLGIPITGTETDVWEDAPASWLSKICCRAIGWKVQITASYNFFKILWCKVGLGSKFGNSDKRHWEDAPELIIQDLLQSNWLQNSKVHIWEDAPELIIPSVAKQSVAKYKSLRFKFSEYYGVMLGSIFWQILIAGIKRIHRLIIQIG